VTERLHIGTAGWSIPRAAAPRFVGEGTHLQRYAGVFGCTEINSSFHRPHAARTYAKWAAATPAGFRFAVKLPRAITHDLQLRRARLPLERFLDETAGLQQKRGPLLVQLPPSHAFDARVAAKFFALMRARDDGLMVCEPRHPTWFSPQADALLVRFQIGRVAADPAPVADGDCPGGWGGIVYFRLHGSPRKYWSRYDTGQIAALAESLSQPPTAVSAWCVFDNTASGAAIENAWELQSHVQMNRAIVLRPSG
jgi:uncharacterized protein YecE (DUF72 family)